jgi:beta-mannosidase
VEGDEFHILVNGERVFCRGAVWMPIDPVSLRSTRDEVRQRLELAISAGFNMLRLSGTTVYEEKHFYELCDELGIMVWQDVMLANMDVPADDTYLALLKAEIDANLPTGPSLTIVCGSSETEQQATMMGHGADVVGSLPMRTHLPAWVDAAAPGVPYVASTPTGGHLPFSVDTGVGHYFGVGAYLRPLADARQARVTFAAESLAFANVPRPAAVEGPRAARSRCRMGLRRRSRSLRPRTVRRGGPPRRLRRPRPVPGPGSGRER